VPVHDEDTRESLLLHRADDVRDDGNKCGVLQARAAGVRREAVHAVGDRRQDGDAERLGRFHRRALGEDVVGLEREVRVLLGRADGQDDPVVGL
jgi:hypothetical protein